VEPQKRIADEWFYLAQSYSALKDYSNAFSSYRSAIEKNPDHAGYKLQYARLLNIYGNAKEAGTLYNEILTTDSVNIPALSELGLIYVNNKEYNKSLPLYERLVRLNSNDFLSNYYIAYSLFQTARSQADSVKVYNSLMKCFFVNNKYIPVIDLTASYFYSKGQYIFAASQYGLIERLSPNNPEPLYKDGLCLEKVKFHEAAANRFLKAVKLDSANFNYYSHLGYNYFLTGKNDSAIITFKKALLLNKDNPTICLNLGMAYLNIDSLALARSCFEKASANYGIEQYSFIQNQLAYINLKQRNIKPAKEYCDKVLMLDPQNAPAQYNLARCYDELGNAKIAVVNYQKALPLLSEAANLKDELEFAKKRLKELKK
jgi:tetratricopeptide (TPR) repeat protein